MGAIVFVPRDAEGAIYVVSMGVQRDQQDRGIGTDLKRTALNVGSEAGAVKVASEVHRNNARMQKVNEKLGISFTVDPDNGKFFLYAAAIQSSESNADNSF